MILSGRVEIRVRVSAQSVGCSRCGRGTHASVLGVLVVIDVLVTVGVLIAVGFLVLERVFLVVALVGMLMTVGVLESKTLGHS